MYKLLTTAAVIMTVATPSIANEWKGHKDLVNNLKSVYENLDGQTQFGLLEGQYGASAGGTGVNGQLSNFFATVDQGVTYITLDVDETTHQISAGINEGKTFDEIKESADDLVNRVNYDLFDTVDTTGDGYIANATFDNYSNPNKHDIIGTPDSGDKNTNEYSSNVGGLLGTKVNELTGNVDTVNDFLLAETLTGDQRTNFISYWKGEDGATSVQSGLVDTINSNISNLNTVIDTASQLTDEDGNVTSSPFFGNIGLGGLDTNSVNNFVIPSYNSFSDIGADGAGGYTSISNWASGVQSVQVDAGIGQVTTTGSVAVDDAAAGTITVTGSEIAAENGSYTYADGVFVKNP